MKINQKKLERQNLGVHKWFNSSQYKSNKDKQGTLNYYTGVGKTFTAILIIKKMFSLDKEHNFIILVPSEELQKQWNARLLEQFNKTQLKRITVLTGNWVISNDYKISTNTLIVDELHEFYSDELIKTINGSYIKYSNSLALTATYEDPKKRHLLIKEIFPVIDEIGEQEAIKEGYIAPFIEYNLAVSLTEQEEIEYAKFTNIISKNINKFGKGGLNLATKCLSGGLHNGKKYTGQQFVYGWAVKNGWKKDLDLSIPSNNEINELWNPYKVFGYATTLMNAIRFRKNLLYNSENKIKTCIELAKRFEGIKSIYFSQSTAFADKLNLSLKEENLKSVVYHSQLKTELRPGKTGKLIKFGKTRLKREAIESIKTGKATILCTASSLDKGFDEQSLVIGVTASGTSNFNQYKQRGGRVKRINVFNDDKVALLINLYVKDSKDETWLTKRQSKSNNIVHWVNSISEIEFTYVETDINLEEI